ncbi:MAG TPA: hypothetical protein VN709_09650 [Terriglobales bacterium]|nr:hypothetical protein [Terriglobales bacterium]
MATLTAGAAWGQSDGTASEEHHARWAGWAGMTGMAVTATAVDVALSRHCERTYAGCREGNPLLPRSAAGTWAVEASLTGGLALWSRHMERERSRWWRLPLLGMIGAHAVGAGSAWIAMRRLGKR